MSGETRGPLKEEQRAAVGGFHPRYGASADRAHDTPQVSALVFCFNYQVAQGSGEIWLVHLNVRTHYALSFVGGRVRTSFPRVFHWLSAQWTYVIKSLDEGDAPFASLSRAQNQDYCAYEVKITATSILKLYFPVKLCSTFTFSSAHLHPRCQTLPGLFRSNPWDCSSLDSPGRTNITDFYSWLLFT